MFHALSIKDSTYKKIKKQIFQCCSGSSDEHMSLYTSTNSSEIWYNYNTFERVYLTIFNQVMFYTFEEAILSDLFYAEHFGSEDIPDALIHLDYVTTRLTVFIE